MNPKVFNPAKAATPLCKNLALATVALQEKNKENYEKIARQIYAGIKNYSTKKTPGGAAVMSFILGNRLAAFDTLDFQLEVLSNQLALLDTGSTTQSIDLVYTTIMSGRKGWPLKPSAADQPKTQKINTILEKALLAQTAKGQFIPQWFNWMRAIRKGQKNWKNNDTGNAVIQQLIKQKKLLNTSTWRLGGDTAATTLMWLIYNEFPQLKAQYPCKSFFDDWYVAECSRTNQLDFAYWHYGTDSQGKIVNMATRKLQAYRTLPFSYQAFKSTNNLWKWHGQCLRKDTNCRKQHAVNEADRGKLITMLTAAYGTNRFDEYARGDYYFAADTVPNTPDGRAAFFKKLATFITRARITPERVAPPSTSMKALKTMKDLTPREINTLLAIFPSATPARWSSGRSYELLLPTLHPALLTQERYTDLLITIPYFWKMAKDMNSTAMFKQMAGYSTDLLKEKLPDLAGVYSSVGLNLPGKPIPDNIRITLMATRLKALVNIGGTISVDRSDPRYPIFAAQTAYLTGNLQHAWELYLSAPAKVMDMFKELDPNFCLWLISRNTEIRNLKQAEELARAMMQWLDSLSKDYDREIQARLMIAYGDIAFARQEYPKARAMYARVVATKDFKNTKARNMAELRIAEVDRLTKNYDSAIARLEKLSRRMDRYLQTESAYQLAIIKYDQKDYVEAARLLTQVFVLEPNHPEGRILQGRVNLQLKKYIAATEINVGLLSSQKIIVPGKPIKIRLNDRNLAVVGKNSQIEVRVWTDSGDEEFMNLVLASDSKTRFEGQLSTILEATKKGDHVLQILGNDKIYYDYSDKFKKANRLAAADPMSMTVASDATLIVSAGKILSAEEEKKEALQLLADADRAMSLLGSDPTNDPSIRPGNPLRIRVIDPDQSTTPQKDTVTVKVTAFSGDKIPTMPLEETATHSGVFEGFVPTKTAGAQAYASDSSEGRFPFYAISTETYPAWIALQNNRRPKTFSVDLNDNVFLGTMNIAADTLGRKLKKFYVQRSINGKDFVTIGSWPTQFKNWNGNPEIEIARYVRRSPPRTLGDIQRYLNSDSFTLIGKGSRQERITRPLANLLAKSVGTRIEFKPKKIALPDDKIVGHFRAAFTLPTRQTRLFKLTTSTTASKPDHMPRCFFAIDNKKATKDSGTTIKRSFKKGIHFIDVYFYAHHRTTWTMELLSDSDTPPYTASFPHVMLDRTANPNLTNALPQSAATVSNNAERTSFDVRFAPKTRARVIRLLLSDFETDAPAIRKISLTTADGKSLLPTKADFVATSKNQILEIVAGDKINITYHDNKVVSRGKGIHERIIRADFHNARIFACTYEVIYNRKKYIPLYRFAPGEKFDVMINDPDCDISDKRDVVKFTAKTQQGKSVKLQALETEEHSGEFIGSVFTVKDKPARPTDLQVAPEEYIVVAYEDKENTDPGIPWTRQQVVQQVFYEPPQLRVYDVTSVPLDEKKIEQLKKETGRRFQGVSHREENFSASRDLIATRPIKADPSQPATIISDGPLLVELIYPSRALSSISTADIYLQTLSARKAAGVSEQEFDPTLPGTIKISATPSEFSSIQPASGYASVLVRGDPYASGPVIDGRFSCAIKKIFGNREEADELDALVKPLPGKPKVPDPLFLHSNDKIFVGFPAPDAGGVTNWMIRPVIMTSDIFMDVMDRIYRQNLTRIYVGENLYLRIRDRSRDTTTAIDAIPVTVSVSSGFSTNIPLAETFEHTGCFKGVIKPIYFEDKAAQEDAGAIPVKYGDRISITYTPISSNQSPITRSVLVAKGSDGTVVPFTKQFKDPDMAIKTQFAMAEAFFELAKKHRALDQISLARREIAQGKKLLEEAIRDYPDMQVRGRADYLLADLTLEFANDAVDEKIKRQKYLEALYQFSEMIMLYPDSLYAPKAQYKKALTLEKMGDIDKACEEYVKLSYLYPDNELVAETIARLGNYFSSKGKEFLDKAERAKSPEAKEEQERKSHAMFKTAAEVFGRLAPRFPTHKLSGKTMVLSGQCYMRAKEMTKATEMFDMAIKQITDDNDLIAEAMYWRADAFMKQRGADNYRNAYRQFKKLTWDHPASKWAKFARGRLTEPALNRIMEEEAKAGE